MTEPKKEKERDPSLNLYQRLAAAWIAVMPAQKKMSGASGNYGFVGHAEASEKVREVLFSRGVVVFSDTVERRDSPMKDKKGNDVMLTSLRVAVTFVNVDKPAERECVNVWGDGLGNDDKGPGKAFSYALKYALMKTSLLPTKDLDDIEQHSNT